MAATAGEPVRRALAGALRIGYAHDHRLHECRVPGLAETLWIVPTVADAERLVGKGITRGRIWTAHELADALDAGWTAQDFAAVAAARLIFDGDVVNTSPRSER